MVKLSKNERINQIIELNANLVLSGSSNQFYDGMAQRVILVSSIANIDETSEDINQYISRKRSELINRIEGMSNQEANNVIVKEFKKANKLLDEMSFKFQFDSENSPYNGEITKSLMIHLIRNSN